MSVITGICLEISPRCQWSLEFVLNFNMDVSDLWNLSWNFTWMTVITGFMHSFTLDGSDHWNLYLFLHLIVVMTTICYFDILNICLHCQINSVSSFRTLALSNINKIADVVFYLTDDFCKAILTINETLLPNRIYLHEG